MKYKCWRSNTDKNLHLICRDGEFESLPQRVRTLGPWMGSYEGVIAKLKPHYRLHLAEQGFTIVYRRPIEFEPEQS